MPSLHKIVLRLTEQTCAPSERRRDLHMFAELAGWKPSDEIEQYPGTEDFANGHLLVEHGLDNAAVISFLRSDRPYEDLDGDSRSRLLSISYNNLVDWHFLPDSRGLTVIFNQTKPATRTYRSRAEEPGVWEADSFDLVTANRPSSDFKALDDTLIATIRFWKKALRADLGKDATNERISSLFNTLIFLRVMEDTQRWQGQPHRALLLDALDSANCNPTLADCVMASMRKLGHPRLPKVLRDCEQALSFFEELDKDTLRTLFKDFYFNRFAPYKYDFSLISKHALGRVYESYVSLLKEKDSPQRLLFKDLPDEVVDRSLGGVYTPQYIARFFARFLREHLPPRTFRNIATIDPACGSGMFLRTVLEMQCDTLHNGGTLDAAKATFRNTVGIDVDASACKATELSLSLLHFSLTGTFPKKLTIHNAEAIEFVQKSPQLHHSFDAVIANPPFVKWDRLQDVMKTRVSDIMAGDARGKCDLSLAFVKLGLQLLRPEGYLLYVLPHSFLLADNARRLRDIFAAECWIHVIADLSEIPVFEGVGSYVILLIAQKRSEIDSEPPPAAVVLRCRELVGRALQMTLEQRWTKNDLFEVFEVDQHAFSGKHWVITSPEQVRISAKLQDGLPLSDVASVRQGMLTGADSVFVRDVADVPRTDRRIWVSFLRDRNMQSYCVPANTDQVVFFPYAGNRRVDEKTLKARYPDTWAYLQNNRQALKSRKSVASGGIAWWEPVRPRSPDTMMHPKLVIPHLVLKPRFALDAKGKYAVSHCPYIMAKSRADDLGLLKYLLCVLNSAIGHWQLITFSHKYSRGYAMLEVKTLNDVRIPSPAKVAPKVMRRMQSLVEKLIANAADAAAQIELDKHVADLYGLTTHERTEIGMGA